MSQRQGLPIWYELMTPDPDAATRFYGSVVGWTVGAAPAAGPDYRMIEAADGAVAGMMRLDAAMAAGGARPGWLFYVGVADPDATAAAAVGLGAQLLMPPTDIPGVGRFALLADPQGAPFYIMRGDSAGTSTAFARGQAGHGSWNELSTGDVAAALGFYAALLGWENRETMAMGPGGGYHFLDAGETRLGAAVEMKDQPPAWRFYFAVDDLAAAIGRVTAGGGRIDMGPHPVPGGEVIAIGTDPQGAPFALVGPA